MDVYLCFIASNKNPNNKQCMIDIVKKSNIHDTTIFGFPSLYHHKTGGGKCIRVFKLKLNNDKLTERNILHPDKELSYITNNYSYSEISIKENTNELYSILHILVDKLKTHATCVADGGGDGTYTYYFDDDLESVKQQRIINDDITVVNNKYNEENNIHTIFDIKMYNGTDITIYEYDENKTYVREITELFLTNNK